jgi:ATP-binding cassette, subfamily A (ABC1), member 3
MSLGELQCVGSTHFLKSTYGAGYNLIFDKRSSATASQVLHLTQFIQTHIPGAVYNPPPNTDAEVQLQYTLPFDSVSQFGPFFLALDNNLADLCVSKYGVTITSLEDVFLKVDSRPPHSSAQVGEDHSAKPNDNEQIGSSQVFQVSFLWVINFLSFS